MQEALHSFNVKFKMQGFECQLTCRDDETGTGKIVTQGQAVVRMLAGLAGITPSNGNGHTAAAQVHPPEPLFPEEPAPRASIVPVCVKCQSQNLELVSFKRDGKPRQAYKCQECGKWQPEKK